MAAREREVGCATPDADGVGHPTGRGLAQVRQACDSVADTFPMSSLLHFTFTNFHFTLIDQEMTVSKEL